MILPIFTTAIALLHPLPQSSGLNILMAFLEVHHGIAYQFLQPYPFGQTYVCFVICMKRIKVDFGRLRQCNKSPK